jgi:hypothetical protein
MDEGSGILGVGAAMPAPTVSQLRSQAAFRWATLLPERLPRQAGTMAAAEEAMAMVEVVGTATAEPVAEAAQVVGMAMVAGMVTVEAAGAAAEMATAAVQENEGSVIRGGHWVLARGLIAGKVSPIARPDSCHFEAKAGRQPVPRLWDTPLIP